MRIVLLDNPSSGSGAGPSGDDLAGMLRSEGAEVERLPLERAAEVGGVGAERAVVAGGDGSVAPAALAAGAAGLALAVVPTGTANDFARRMQLPADPAEACRLAARGAGLRRLDLGCVGERPFVNVATAGLAVSAARRAGPLKGLLGPLAYLAGALRTAVSGHPVECAVTVDGRRIFAGPAWQVMVACSGAFGAGSRIDDADPSDGLLDVVVVAAGPRRRLARHAYGLRRGRITAQPGVVSGRGAEVALELPPGAELNVDGEVVPASPRLSVRPGCFSLVVP